MQCLLEGMSLVKIKNLRDGEQGLQVNLTIYMDLYTYTFIHIFKTNKQHYLRTEEALKVHQCEGMYYNKLSN